MRLLDRFIEYCKIDTTADENSHTSPSSMKQFDLAKLLLKQLQDMKIEASLDEHCYVYAHLPSNTDKKCANVGFVAHMDTAPAFSGTNVSPRVIENYDGKDIVLNPSLTMSVEQFPQLKNHVGKTLVVTDGTTLLGADDKAGVSAIMEALCYYVEHPEVKHGNISVCFTPDEEVGKGTAYFDVKKFNADFAYTMDGGSIECYSDETFNAYSATIDIHGFSIHPGSAKDKMINAASIACRLHSYLPSYATPEHTENREGFIHLYQMSGDIEHAKLEYIIRDHDLQKIHEKIDLLKHAVALVNAEYHQEIACLKTEETYLNMKEVLKHKPEVSEYIQRALTELNVNPVNEVTRGGTDGSHLSFMGVPCPNIGLGAGNGHGPYEYCVIEDLQIATEVIKNIVRYVLGE